MWWAVILNEAKRNEESLSSVATFEEILRCAQNDRFGLMSIRGAYHGSRPRNDRLLSTRDRAQ